MEIILFIPLLLSFLISLLVLPHWIKNAKRTGLKGRDMNKYEPSEVAEAGGVVVIASFIIGVLSYIAIKTFILKTDIVTIEIFALITSLILVSFIGMIDDILGWRIGLSKKARIVLILLASTPLVVINAGHSSVNIPFIGEVALGLLYPLIIIPLGFVGASTTFNFLAGYNSLEAGQGVLLVGALSLVAYLTGSSWLALIGLCMIFALLAFLIFNKYPAKVFPGDILTYSVGALIAIMAILGNFEKIAVFVFIPYILETGLKIRGRLKKQSFAIPNEDGSLEMPYKKIYGLTHLSLFILKKFKRKVYESDVTYLIFIFQIVICLLSLVVFREGIFLR